MSSSPDQSPHTGVTPSLSLEKSVELEARDDEEEEEEDSGVDEPSQKFSYRKFGVAFLLLAIVVAVIFASVPTVLNDHGTLTNIKTGYLYFTLLGIFLLLLLSCLFCTYYLGGSRDTWEDPVFTGIRFNFSNTTAIIGLFVEFVQVCGFSFPNARFTGSDHLQRMLYAAVPYKPGGEFNVMYWIMFVMAFSPYIFVVSVRMIIYTINHRKGETEAALFVQNYQQKIYSILWFLVNTIYLPVISTMMGGIDCTFSKPGFNGKSPQFDSDLKSECYSKKQLGFMVASLIALVIYYPAASFAQAQTQNISDIKFKPKIVFIFVQGKVVLAGMFVFFTNHAAAYLTVVFVTNLVFLVLNVWAKPCLVQWVNQMRTIFFTVSAWTTLCSIISLSKSINLDVPLGLLIAGWIVAIIGMPIFFILKYKFGDAVLGLIHRTRGTNVGSPPGSPSATSSTPA